MLTEFFDSTQPNINTFGPPTDDSFSDGYVPDMSLAEWFRRPVKIAAYDWIEGSSILTTIDPWSLFFNNPDILNKLKGFSRMQATLHVKLTINASPYQYGAGNMSYLPLSNFGNGAGSGPTSEPALDSFAGGHCDPALNSYFGVAGFGTAAGNLIVKTCRPNVWFYPQFSQGAEMVLPFCYYKNWINLDSNLTEVANLGRLTLYTPIPLKTTSTPTVNPVSVTIFAWCEMHKVSAPSYSMQGGDEYVDRPVSTTMSALSTLARTVSRIPMLGPYAMATSSVLTNMGTAARWFGYSNPPVISDVHALRPNYMASYSSPEVCVQHEKLSLDPKNEVTVDSRTVGLDGVDQMSISHIVGREVYFGLINWAATAATTQCLSIHHVSPMIYAHRQYIGEITNRNCKSIQMTPGCQIGTLFDMWHGVIKYKFTVVASQFHRGRLLVSYEPDGFQDSYTSSAYTSPRTISKIWDITENPSFEFEVPWMASTTFLKTGGFPYVATGSTSGDLNYFNPPALPGTWRYSDGNQNGSIVVSVLNALTSGNTDAGVTIMVSIDCSQVEYANPIDLSIPMSISDYMLQSGDDVLAQSPDVVQVATVPVYEPPVKHIVYTGEIVRSIRTLMHRTNFYSRYNLMTDFQAPISGYSPNIPDIVIARLVADSVPNKLTGYVSAIHLPMLPYGTGKLSYTKQGGLMILNGSTNANAGNAVIGMHLGIPTVTSYLVPSYVGWRGSSVYHVKKVDRTDTTVGVITDMSISRSFKSISRMFQNFNVRTSFIYDYSNSSATSQLSAHLGPAQYINKNRLAGGYSTTGMSGFSATNPQTVDVVDAVVPWYSNFRMAPANPIANLVWNTNYNSLSWNDFDQNDENVGGAQACVNATVKLPRETDNTIANMSAHPWVDIYHKAGVDFSAFWYLNPPAIHVYVDYTDGYPADWA